ncbi:uncharacterized protein LOC131935822 [Physella acuta]|uniref:uncharacterized protein LOC131935822 n=1 Tax=Physella acuta TaxID=109671 RepID=UPI0027DB78C3|nr:uncharacterized protein LOC131935822 [Physella acuta]
MATVDLYQICEKYRDVLTKKERKAKKGKKAKKAKKTQGILDLSGLKLTVTGQVEWKSLPVAQQQAQGYLFPQRISEINVSRIHEHYRNVKILSGRVVGIYNLLKMKGPDGSEISIDPGCSSCDFQDQAQITVQGSCQYENICSYYLYTPQVTVTLADERQKYSFECWVVCEGSVKLVLENGSYELGDILGVVSDVKESSLIRTINKKDAVCWKMTGEYTTNGNPQQTIEIE